MPENGEALAVFHFQDLTPGSYTLEETGTPAGYAGLTVPVQIKIEEDGQVFIDEEQQPNLLVSGEKNNQIELIVTNQVKVSLPETGGNWHGWLAILSTGLLVLLAGSYLYVKRKDKPSLK
ncbi:MULTISPECIES: SpaA isopeptide-forming pilin-related protein [unclassified Enterococcus]|uniref:prealbumin-like fold domain-containing protein n=1 Tax=unclassified Enterococcus TaxID=2608891 RepID=UPI003FA38A09